MQRWGQNQSWTPGAVWTKKRKGNLSQQAQEQQIKSPQSTWWNPASVEYLNRQQIIPKLRRWTLGATVDLGFAVWDWLVSDLHGYLGLLFSACSHWWICTGLIALFFFLLLFNFLILIILKKIYFNNIIIFFYFILFYFIFLSFIFFSLFFLAVWLTGWWYSGQVSGLSLWGGRAAFRTLVHQRPPGPR